MIQKICFAASSGGHLEEISRLKEIRDAYDCFLFTERGSFSELDFCDKVYYVRQINRKEKKFLTHFIRLFIESAKILKEEQPDCIISTGALATFPICVIGKAMKKKVIFIESFARVDGSSLTGKLMKKVADLYIVQWEELLQFVPDAVYGGGIF
ncbi:MAG: polysaccharide biosynthesis protein [Lachnospiraceae bacterium]|nr:polysaccharide biosynthesis protein [Lachnospiraceae bacterium]MBQ3600145.1 polysaccharide biosynthesis protein [Lachnospiraceae bacterium]